MKYLIILMTLNPLRSAAQLNIKVVICNQNKEPLPLTNVVLLNKEIGTSTDENGRFYLSGINNSDSLKITNIAYLPLVIAVGKIRFSDTLFLTKNIKELKEIEVVNLSKKGNQDIQLGYYRYHENAEFILSPGEEVGVFINNTIKREAHIKGIFLRLKQKGICENNLRIRMLNKDGLNPDSFLNASDENIIISNKELKLRNYVDLSDKKIIMPADGILVVVELLSSKKDIEKQSYPSISANMKEYRNLVWLNFRDRKWSHENIPRLPNDNYMTPNISLKVAY